MVDIYPRCLCLYIAKYVILKKSNIMDCNKLVVPESVVKPSHGFKFLVSSWDLAAANLVCHRIQEPHLD